MDDAKHYFKQTKKEKRENLDCNTVSNLEPILYYNKNKTKIHFPTQRDMLGVSHH